MPYIDVMKYDELADRMNHLPTDLDMLLAGVAAAGPVERSLLVNCRRCRNSMLYLMYPGSDKIGEQMMERTIAARVRALADNHTHAHTTREHPDDVVPRFAEVL